MVVGKSIEFDGNAAMHWPALKSPIKSIFNAFCVTIFKYIPPSELKNSLYRSILGVKIGKDVAISPDVLFDPFFPELIEIGDGTLLGWGCRIFTHEFHLHRVIIGKVKVGSHVMLGGFVTVRPGVSIGDKAIVQANSFVDKDVLPGKLVGGNPIIQIKKKE